MGKKILMLFVCTMLSASMAWAQTRTVTGTVVDSETGEPIPGAQVKVQGTSLGAVADSKGVFVLKNLPKDAKNVIVSFMGMKTADVALRDGMKVILIPDTKAMDEVMVVAYGTQTKSSFTGSAAILDSKEIGKMQITNAFDALKGKAAGVQIFNATGQPGTTPTIRIRGFNSMIASQAPLIVLDGSPYDGSWNDINPADVESMTVLKDAASTALYGARGGNGVIIITTKTGKRHKDAEINFEAKWGSNMKGNRDYDVISDPRGYYETYYKGLYSYAKNQRGMTSDGAWKWANANMIDRTNGYGLGYQVYNVPEGEAFIGTNGKVNPNATLGNVVTGKDGNKYYLIPDNWDNEIYHNGLRQQYTVSASGASDKGTYYISTDYLGNKGITYNSNYERLTARLKADYMLKKWLKAGANVSYSHTDRSYMSNEGKSNVGNLFALHNIAPIYPVFVRDEFGNVIYNQDAGIKTYDYGDGNSALGLSRPYLSQSNPISDLLVDTRRYKGNAFNATGTIDVYLPKNITFTSINNVYYNTRDYTSITNPYFGQYASSNGIITREVTYDLNTNFQQRLRWQGQFDDHDIEVMGAHEYYRAKSWDLYGNKHNMFSQQNKELDGAVIVDDCGSTNGTYNTESWLFRAMYNYASRYYVQASIMAQGSSAFHPDHRWGVFWSASFGWMISKEKFMAKAKWLDELKFKISYGENGNDGSLNGYYYTNRYSIVNSNGSVSLVPSTLGKNEKLSWEKSAKFNTGFDFSMFKDRFYGSIEYYNNRTIGLITSVPYAPSFGYTSFYDNVGNMSNQGIEIDLHGVAVRTKDIEWSLFANATWNKNRMTELIDARKSQVAYSFDPETGNVEQYMGYSSGSNFYSEGLSRYSYYGKKYAGVYNEQTYATTGDKSYDPTKGGMALYYMNQYKMLPSGDYERDDKGNKIIDRVVTTTNGSTADMYVCGDVLPRLYGGFGTSFSWKGFDLGLDFTYQLGGKVYDSEYASLMAFSVGYGYHVDQLNAWTTSNPTSNIPRLNVGDSYNATASDRFLTSATCLTLNNLTFGYTLPKHLLRKCHINKVRIFLVGDNLYTWSARKGLDPRMDVTGASSGLYYSSIRSVSAGVQVGF